MKSFVQKILSEYVRVLGYLLFTMKKLLNKKSPFKIKKGQPLKNIILKKLKIKVKKFYKIDYGKQNIISSDVGAVSSSLKHQNLTNGQIIKKLESKLKYFSVKDAIVCSSWDCSNSSSLNVD